MLIYFNETCRARSGSSQYGDRRILGLTLSRGCEYTCWIFEVLAQSKDENGKPVEKWVRHHAEPYDKIFTTTELEDILLHPPFEIKSHEHRIFNTVQTVGLRAR